MKNIFINSIIFIISFIIMLFIIEGVLRIKNLDMRNYNIEMWKYTKELKVKSENPKLGFYHKPSSESILQSVKIRTNSFGLRGKEISKEKSVNRRVLFLGSSATLGWGVKEENTMISLLNKRMGSDVEVLNAGVGNYNSVRYIELFFTKLKELHPTDIVIHFFLNDAEELHVPKSNWFLQNSQLAVVTWNLINKFGNNGTLIDYYNKIYDENYIGYINMNNALDKLIKYCEKKDIRLYFTLMPDLHYLNNTELVPYYKKVTNLVNNKGIKFLDLGAKFNNNVEVTKYWVMPNDAHPNELAHKIMADQIYPFLRLK